MHREVVLAWLAVLFGLMAAMLTVAAALTSWPVLLVAVPLGAMAALLWYHASGRLDERMRQHARRRRARRQRRERAAAAGVAGGPGDGVAGARTTADAAGPRAGPRGGGPFGAAGSRFGNRRRAAGGRRRAAAGAGPGGAAAGGAGARGAAGGAARPDPGMSHDRALSVLDLDPGADDAAIRAAYRDKVKETHPDRGGDRDAFIEVTEAYEALGGST